MLFFLLADVPHGLYGTLVHPTLRANILKNLRDVAIEGLIDCLFVLGTGRRRVDLRHQPIQEPHDLLVVIPILAVREDHIRLLQEVVLKRLPVVDGLDLLVDGLVDVRGLRERVLLLHVGHDALLDVLVDDLHLPLREVVFFGEQQDVLEDALRAEGLGVLVGHVVLGERVEGRGKDVAADVGQPLLERVIVQLPVLLLYLGQVDDDGAISGLQLEVADLLDGLLHERVQDFEELGVSLRV